MTELALRPSIPAARYGERLDAARRLAAQRGLTALLIGVGADLRYLTGYDALLLERLTMLVVPGPAHAPYRIVVPRLEADPARRAPAMEAGIVEIVTWEEIDSPHDVVARLVREAAGPSARADALEVAVSDRLWAGHVLRLQELLPGGFVVGSTVMRQLRIVKDPAEVELLRMAALAADRVVDQVAAGRLVGRTEAEVSREVRDRLVLEGHDLAAFAIVGSGPNAASPHHEASDRVIGAGEPIVLDIGGQLAGYCSDTTRTIWVTGGDPAKGPTPEFLNEFDVLRDATAAATAAVRPGVAAERIDAAARDVIAAAGFGADFIHRTGHGIGLEEHEDPYLVAGNHEELQDGMAFSIEPGIYHHGHWGMRLEDIVVCRLNGPDVLNRSSLDLRIVAGI